MVKLTFRPWSEFVELNTFKVPDQKDYVDRLQVNLIYYQANYVGVVLLNLLLVCFWRPFFLIGLAGIVGSAIYLFSVRTAPIVVAEKVLTKKEVLLAYGVFSFVLVLLFGGANGILGLAVATLIILLHASFRQRSLKSKVNVGLINMMGKSEDGPDDTGADEENPPAGGSADLSKLGSNDAILKEQQQQRSAIQGEYEGKIFKRKEMRKDTRLAFAYT